MGQENKMHATLLHIFVLFNRFGPLLQSTLGGDVCVYGGVLQASNPEDSDLVLKGLRPSQ